MPTQPTECAKKITVELSLDEIERIVLTLQAAGDFHLKLAGEEERRQEAENSTRPVVQPESGGDDQDDENWEMPPLYKDALDFHLLASALKKVAIDAGDDRYRSPQPSRQQP